MPVLLIADHDDSSCGAATRRALTAARLLGDDVTVLVAGSDCAAAAADAARLAGVGEVLLADGVSLGDRLAEPMAELILGLAGGFDAIVAPATTMGKNVLPRVAARLDVMQVSEVVAVLGRETFSRPTYAGNVIETVRSRDDKKVLTVRTSAFDATPTGTAVARVTAVAVPPVDSRVVCEDRQVSAGERPDLGSARIVVSGGRAFGSEEQFEALLGPLAHKLNAAVGASRAAVDAGYAPNELQVGQTGRIVAPEIYIACGISGAVQHLAGMKESRVIVAINSDPEAPIMKIADYALVGDLFTVLPELTGKL